jgi:hypothetical protein
MKTENIENRINQLIKQIANLEEVQTNLIFLKAHSINSEARLAYNLLDANFMMQKQLLEELLAVYKLIEKQLNNKIQQN